MKKKKKGTSIGMSLEIISDLYAVFETGNSLFIL